MDGSGCGLDVSRDGEGIIDLEEHEQPPSDCGCAGCQAGGDCDIEVVSHERGRRSDDPMVALGAETLGVVASALDVEGGGWYLLDRRGRLTHAVAYEPQPWPWPAADALRTYASRLRHLDPFSRVAHSSGRIQTVLTTDDLGHVDFSQHPFAQRFLSRLGFGHLAMVNLRMNGQLAAQLWVARQRGRGGWSTSELTLLRRIHGLASLSMRHAATPPATRARQDRQLLGRLTHRQLEVAQLAAAGATNREIAHELSISPATVGTHLHKILSKVGVRSRTELARLAIPATHEWADDG